VVFTERGAGFAGLRPRSSIRVEPYNRRARTGPCAARRAWIFRSTLNFFSKDETMKRALILALALAGVLPGVTTAAHAQDAQRGSRKVAMCEGCHQIVGYQTDFPQVYKVPKIAGQDAKYIASALKAYRAGDRKQMQMRGIATSLSDEDIEDIAAYYSKLGHADGPVPAALEHPMPDELRAKAATCVACHGANFSTPTDGTIPRLAGQYGDYLYFALRAYATEGNAHYGRNNALMSPMAKMLTDGEAREFTAYLARLPGELRTVQDPRFK
jgi:cytochrome c553